MASFGADRPGDVPREQGRWAPPGATGATDTSPWGPASAPDGRDARRISMPEDVAHDPEVQSLLTGRATEARAFRVLVSGLIAFCVALSVLLLVLAVVSSNDTSRIAQVVWAVVLPIAGAAAVVPGSRSRTVVTVDGIEKTSAFSTTRIPWQRVKCFLGGGTPIGLLVAQQGAGPVRIPTRWHYRRSDAARTAAARANVLFGLTAPVDAAVSDGPIAAVTSPAASQPDADVLYDPRVQRLLTRRVLSSGGFWWPLLVLSPLVLVLPTILLVVGVTTDPAHDTSYRAQIAWAVVLYACLALAVVVAPFWAKADESGITTRGFAKRRQVRWDHVQAFLPGTGLSISVLTTEGKQVSVHSRLVWSAKRRAGDAAFLNRTLRRGVPLAYCMRCQQQFGTASATPQNDCAYHPVDPVPLGELGDGPDRRSWWTFPCCDKFVLAALGPGDEELDPSVVGGCVKGPHNPRL